MLTAAWSDRLISQVADCPGARRVMRRPKMSSTCSGRCRCRLSASSCPKSIWTARTWPRSGRSRPARAAWQSCRRADGSLLTSPCVTTCCSARTDRVPGHGMQTRSRRVEQMFSRLAERSRQQAMSLPRGRAADACDRSGADGSAAAVADGRAVTRSRTAVIGEVFAAIEVIRSEGVSVPPVQQDAERALEISALAHLLGEGRILAGITDELRRSAEVRRSVLGP